MFSSNNKNEEEDMVQALAQELISLAKKNGAQDIYFVPKEKIYELHMRIGDERRLIDT